MDNYSGLNPEWQLPRFVIRIGVIEMCPLSWSYKKISE